MSDLITITIDGKEIPAQRGEMLTKAARRAGIEIPVFCGHPKLDPIGACRMCLVEQETPRGRALITACTTPVSEGMVIHYGSEKAVDARQGTLEMILINHPLDCPICDKGGECPLQDHTLAHGPGKSHFWEEKHHKAKNYPLSDLILLDQERCILCWRCIRYLGEWEDKPQLGLFHRGGETVIDKFPDGELDAYTSGSIIDLCPVGALTNRPARFSYRPWELRKTPSICTHCGQGCNLRIDSRDDIVRRHVARENVAVNDEWICDKGRFADDISVSPARLQQPLARIAGQLQPVSWAEALQRVVSGLKGVAERHGPAAIGAIGSAKASNEANYLLGKFMRGVIGSNNLDHREGAALLADPRGLPSLEAARHADLILLMGCDPSEEMPVLATLLKRAAIRQAAAVVIVHPRRIELARYPGHCFQPAPGEEPALFDALTRATLAGRGEPIPAWLAGAAEDAQITAAANALAAAQRPFILYGSDYAWGFGARAIVASLTNWVTAAGHGDRLGFLHAQANSQGAGDMGMLPDFLPGRRPLADAKARGDLEALWQTELPSQPGLTYGGMLASARGRIKALYLLGANPAGEKPADAAALKALDFLVVQELFLTETAQLADVVLPAASYVEGDGTFTNSERRVQRAPQAVKPVGNAAPDWLILTHLARAYAPERAAAWSATSVAALFAEITQAAPLYAGMTWENLGAGGRQWPWQALSLQRSVQPYKPAALPADPAYPLRLVVGNQLWDDGVMLAASPALAQQGIKAARLHPTDAAALGLHSGDAITLRSRSGSVRTTVHVDDAIKPGTVFLPYSLAGAPAGALFDEYAPRSAVGVG